MLSVKNDIIGNNKEVKRGNLVNYQLRTKGHYVRRLYVKVEI